MHQARGHRLAHPSDLPAPRMVALFSPMAYGPPMAMLPKMLEDDRRLAGWSVGQTAWRLGVSRETTIWLEPRGISLDRSPWRR